MLLKELKEKMFLEKEEIIINKKVTIRGREYILLSFTEEERNKLWVLYKNNTKENKKREEILPNTYNEEYEDIHITNRKELVDNIKESQNHVHIHISEMFIQNQKITFESSTASSVDYFNSIELINLQNFIKKGLIPKEWDDTELSDIIIATYEQNEGENFPSIDKNDNMTISLKIDEDFKEVLIEYPFKVSLGKSEKDTKIHYLDRESKESNFFYLNEIEKCDFFTKSLEKLENNMAQIEEGKRKEVRNSYIESLESVCPKNKDAIFIYYETNDNTQLRFLTKEYLDSEPVYSSTCSAMYFSCSSEEGINGYSKQVDWLKSVEKDFSEEIEIELFSKYVKAPEEVITL